MMNAEHPASSETLRDASSPQEGVAAISVLTVDDHPIFREGIAAVLNLEPDIRLAAEAASVSEAVALYRERRPNVVLMDIQLPDGSGIDATAQICREFPGAKVIILTTYRGDVRALNALRAGALGFLLKNTLRRELVDCVRLVYRGEQYLFAEVALELTRHASDDALTTRETHVLGAVARGQSNKRAGRALGIAEETVKTHMASVMTKLKANDRMHAVLIGIKRGII